MMTAPNFAELPDPWRIPLGEGFHVFPLIKGRKLPALQWTELRDRWPTDEELKRWVAEGCNVAIITGKPSGIIVLDLDSDEAVAEAEARGLPITPRAKTPRGEHVYFKHPGGLIKNNVGLFQGADLRGDGGYVVAPGSIFEPNAEEVAQSKIGGRYEWIIDPRPFDLEPPPLWLLEQLAQQPDRPTRAVPLEQRSEGLSEAAAQLLVSLCSAPQGERNNRLNRTAFKMAILCQQEGLDELACKVSLKVAAQQVGLSPEEIEPTLESGWNAGIKSTSIDATEDGVARAFSGRCADRFLFDHTAGGWFQWVGTHWARDANGAVLQLVRELCRETGKPALRRAAAAKGAQSLAQVDPRHSVVGAWDADPWLLGTPGGVVDLRTGQIRPSRPVDRITKVTSVAPHPESPTRWLSFLRESAGGDEEFVDFLRRMVGYLITGQTAEQAMFFVYGPGGNGKSVFIGLLTRLLGDYAVVASMDSFAANEPQRHANELARLAGSRLVTASETQHGHAWNEPRLKQLTGGDEITARFLYREHFTFRPQFKLVIVGNYKPQLRTVDDAIRRRIHIIPFVCRPSEPDPLLLDGLLLELGGILTWAIGGCLEWQRSGLNPPRAVRCSTEAYFESEDQFGQWIKDACELSANRKETPSKLFEAWSRYAIEVGAPIGGQKQFGDLLETRGLARVKSNGVRYHTGIGLLGDPILRVA